MGGKSRPRVDQGESLADQKAKENAVNKVNGLLEMLSNVQPVKSDFGSQKEYKKYHQVNFASTNINSLLKDIAKAKLQKKYNEPKSREESQEESGNPKHGRGSSMKTQLIRETTSMIQEQLFFEELLQILGERGVDVENLFSYCYERMKIDVTPVDQTVRSHRLLTDNSSCVISEISVLDNASKVLRTNPIVSAKKKRLQLDIRNIKPDIFSSNEDN